METVTRHTHNGIDSEKLELRDMVGFPLEALTTKNTNNLSSGGANDLKSSDSAVIDNMRTRIDELESRLQAIQALL